MDLFEREKEILDVKMLSPLVWAYVGDSVYELFIRTHLVNFSNAKPHKLHIETIKFVKAESQAKILNKIWDNLTEEEQEIFKRGRNAHGGKSKSSDIITYKIATGLEALIGYLHLNKKEDRIKEIIEFIVRN